jgi:hypothetical protein
MIFELVCTVGRSAHVCQSYGNASEIIDGPFQLAYIDDAATSTPQAGEASAAALCASRVVSLTRLPTPPVSTFVKVLTQGSSKEKEAVAPAEVEVSMAES